MSSEQSEPPDLPEPFANASDSSASSGFEYSTDNPQTTFALSFQFLRTWLVVNTLGFAIATTLLFSIDPLFAEAFNSQEHYLSGYVIGAILGPLQAIALRPRLPRLKIWQWTLASILGSYLGVLLGAFASAFIILGIDLSSDFIEFFFLAIFGGMVGLGVGLCQILVLAKQVCGLNYWLGFSVIGRSLGWFSAHLLWKLLGEQPLMNPSNSISDVPIFVILSCGAVGGLTYGAVMAVALPNLTLRQPSISNNLD